MQPLKTCVATLPASVVVMQPAGLNHLPGFVLTLPSSVGVVRAVGRGAGIGRVGAAERLLDARLHRVVLVLRPPSCPSTSCASSVPRSPSLLPSSVLAAQPTATSPRTAIVETRATFESFIEGSLRSGYGRPWSTVRAGSRLRRRNRRDFTGLAAPRERGRGRFR